MSRTPRSRPPEAGKIGRDSPGRPVKPHIHAVPWKTPIEDQVKGALGELPAYVRRAVEMLVQSFDQIEGDLLRLATYGRRRVQRRNQFEDRARRARQPPFDSSAEMVDVGESDDRRLRLGVDIRAERQKRVEQPVDRDAMLPAILLRTKQASRVSGIGCRIRGPRGRACKRMGPNDVSVASDEQLWRRTDEPVDREENGRGERGPKPVDHQCDVDGMISAQPQFAGQDGLGQIAGPDAVTGEPDDFIAPDLGSQTRVKAER